MNAQPMEMPDGVAVCPWCGEVPDVTNDAHFGVDDAGKWGWLQCCANGPEIRAGYRPLDEWRDDAIKAWNERKQTAPSPASVAMPVPDIPFDVKAAIEDVWGFAYAGASIDELEQAASFLVSWVHHVQMKRLAERQPAQESSP